MSDRHADSDSAETVYRDYVSRRLFRSRAGLSLTGCIGILLMIMLIILALETRPI